jgi:hypothetical protein
MTLVRRLEHSISISLRSILKPSDPLICHTVTPLLTNLQAVAMAAPIDSHLIGCIELEQEIEYDTVRGVLGVRPEPDR